nr:hypothetical protein Iba_scaffold15946CG0600 [Ipomoea batatas]
MATKLVAIPWRRRPSWSPSPVGDDDPAGRRLQRLVAIPWRRRPSWSSFPVRDDDQLGRRLQLDGDQFGRHPDRPRRRRP